ncbi:MAG: hypothetical protein R8G34_23335 [Paracoccaceae bacterium]|nr:hypothetical protein [Paracoccaceae bacterium]
MNTNGLEICLGYSIEFLSRLLFAVIQTLKRPLLVRNELWRDPLSEPEIERMLVCSDIFLSIGYDTKRRALQVEFANGYLYRIDDM